METDLQIKSENISLLIHFIRGEKVLLDIDLARLYGVEVYFDYLSLQRKANSNAQYKRAEGGREKKQE